MFLYMDTSALVKKYFKEEGTSGVLSLWRGTTAIITSTVTFAETLAAIHRKRREQDGVSTRQFKRVISSFDRDWQSFVRVDVTDHLGDTIRGLIDHHPLRGFDAMHLASALLTQRKSMDGLLFVCFDKRLSSAAVKEGLSVFPEIQ
jgi:predicted nucleic acid-binding protein